MRLVAALLIAVPVLSLLGAGSTEHGAATPPPPAAGHDVLALGDSVPAGAACGCNPFPQVYGSLLAQRTGAQVAVDNRAVSGVETADVLDQLASPAVEDAVRRADVLLVTIGANDFGDHHDDVVGGTCGPAETDCASDELEALGARLGSVLARLRSLRQGQPTTILVTGYWNVFEDGDVARRAFGPEGLAASLRLTQRANGVIRSVATAAGARYVDLYRAFQEPSRDVTSLMAADGDHPNAAGHQLIARTLLAAGLPRTG
jgi:lysophospholipase L1-like esterase